MLQKLILSAMLLCGGFCLAGCAVNPITGQEELIFYPEEQDIEIGKQYAPMVEKELNGRIEDQVLQNYIDSVGQKVAKISHRPDFDYHFVAVNDKSVNAVALPGGYIFITRGMLSKMENEAQLAGVFGHEIVHVVARDTANMMSKQIGIDLLFAVAMTQTSSRGAVTMADLARQIVLLKYSRNDERDADTYGMDYMVRAGYNPNGAVETMRMLEQEDSVRAVEFMSSHPSPENRVSYLQARVRTHYFNSINDTIIGKEDYKRFVLDRLKNIPEAPEKKP